MRKAAPEQFLEELTDVRWGLFSLNTSRWLLARTWTLDRNCLLYTSDAADE